MPVITSSRYLAPRWLRGGHTQTIFPSFFRRIPELPFVRSRINTADSDFILLDTLIAGEAPSEVAVVLSHGLEGDSRRKYIRGMCLAFREAGWDCVARNFRGCGGEMNKTAGMYHSGQTDDLHAVVEHCRGMGYKRIFLVGFSMGGNQTLKYLGEAPDRVPKAVGGVVVFSVPCDLPDSARVLDQPRNAVYMRYFLKTLREKVRCKHSFYPEMYPLDGLDSMRTFAEFDAQYTAPVHGFASAEDYWQKAACLPHLHRISVPTLLVNAKNDPFLSPGCFPFEAAGRNAALTLEIPEHGGHVGFTSPLGHALYWSDYRAREFIQEAMSS